MSVQSAPSLHRPVIGFAVVAALVLSLAPALTAAAEPETHAELTLGTDTMLTGVIHGEGTGEVQMFAGPRLQVEGSADEIVVEEYTLRSYVVDGPTGDIRRDDDVSEQTDHHFDDASLLLVAAAQGFESLLLAHDDDDRLILGPANISNVALNAYKEPGLLLDERGATPEHTEEENSNFTYVAQGDRFPLPTDETRAEGAPSLYFWNAEFKVENGDGSRHFIAGESRKEILPGYHEIERTFYLVRFEQGHVEAHGSHTAWLDEPVIHLDGALTSTQADGTLNHKDETHHLDDVPLTATGKLVIAPTPSGPVAPIEQDAMHLGTSTPSSGTYDASSTTLSGSSVVIELGGMSVDDDRSSLVPVAATAGIVAIVGAAWALTPQGQWLVMGAAAPLYAKTQRDRLLESPQRERLLQAIQASPGIHISGLRQIAGLSWGTTVYHLRLMEKRELVVSVPRAGQRHFFVKTPRADAARLRSAVATIVGQQTAHRVAFAVLSMPGSCQKELAEHLSVSRRVVAHHIARLNKAELITKHREGGRVRCYPTSALSDALAILDTGETPAVPAAGIQHGDALQPVPVMEG